MGPVEKQRRKLREDQYARRFEKAKAEDCPPVVERPICAAAREWKAGLEDEPVGRVEKGVDGGPKERAVREARRRGRPRVVEDGEWLHVLLPKELIGRLGAESERRGMSRSGLLRVLLGDALK